MNLILKYIKAISLFNKYLIFNLQILAIILQVWSHNRLATKKCIYQFRLNVLCIWA